MLDQIKIASSQGRYTIYKVDSVNFTNVSGRSFVPDHTENMVISCLKVADGSVIFQWLAKLQT
jgi:hypothetical protein